MIAAIANAASGLLDTESSLFDTKMSINSMILMRHLASIFQCSIYVTYD